MRTTLIAAAVAILGVSFLAADVAQARAKLSKANSTIVALAGGDYADPVAAMADVARWCGTPSATSPCLLKIMPGVYDIGSGSLVMQEYVDVEGSGENVTRVTGNSGSGVVRGASNAELRFLSVENVGGGSDAVAISSEFAAPKITHVTASASGGTALSCGVSITGLSSPSQTPLMMTNVTVRASGTATNCGICLEDARPMLTNVKVTASGGSLNYGVRDDNDTGGSVRIEHSVISGDDASIFKCAGFGKTRVASTRLEGSVVNAGAITGAVVTCAGVWDGSLVFFASSCPDVSACP